MIAKKDICEEDYGKWLEEYLRARCVCVCGCVFVSPPTFHFSPL